jgi:hypothetical protein
MNDQTAKLIEQLATKLGTTSEYLWGILLMQAPVNATVILVQLVLLTIAGIGLFKAHRHLSDDDNKVSYDRQFGVEIGMGIITLVYIILLIIGFCHISQMINGFFNPEFWAVDYIMCKLGK